MLNGGESEREEGEVSNNGSGNCECDRRSCSLCCPETGKRRRSVGWGETTHGDHTNNVRGGFICPPSESWDGEISSASSGNMFKVGQRIAQVGLLGRKCPQTSHHSARTHCSANPGSEHLFLPSILPLTPLFVCLQMRLRLRAQSFP